MSETILKVEDLKTSFMTSSGEVQAVRDGQYAAEVPQFHVFLCIHHG